MSGRAANGAPVSSVAHLTDSLGSASDPEATTPLGRRFPQAPRKRRRRDAEPSRRRGSGAAQTTAIRYPSLGHAPIDTSLSSAPAQPAGLRPGTCARAASDQPTGVQPGEVGPADRAPPASNPSLPTVSPPRCLRVPGRPPPDVLAGSTPCGRHRGTEGADGFPRRARSIPRPPPKGQFGDPDLSGTSLDPIWR